MLGNDIVDLSDPEAAAGAQHERFDRRVFAPRELARLADCPQPARLRWTLWAAKESAYKAARREHPATVFAPSEFVVDLDGAIGSVTHRETRYAARIEFVGDCVHAVVAIGSEPAWTIWEAAEMREAQSRGVRALAVERIAARLRVDRVDLRIEPVARAPRLLFRGEPTNATLSLAHHGRYVGFACRFPSQPARSAEAA